MSAKGAIKNRRDIVKEFNYWKLLQYVKLYKKNYLNKIKLIVHGTKMNVSMKKEVAEELVTFKLKQIQILIEEILQRWNEKVIEDFLEKAKDGTLHEAENDAIELKQLVFEEEKLQNLLKKFA